MNPIPDLGLPPTEFDPKATKVRFRFSFMRKNGKGSRKEFRKLAPKDRRRITQKFWSYSRLTVTQFRSSDGVHLKNRNYRGLKVPELGFQFRKPKSGK